MGLDVYLYYCPDRAAAKKLEQTFEQETESYWERFCAPDNEWKQLSKEEQDRRYAIYKAEQLKISTALGLDKDGEHPSVKKISMPSAKYPDHYFKVGYFRSSYNDTGINSYLRRLGLPDLYHVMGATDDYEFTPDWMLCKSNAKALLTQLREIPNRGIDVLKIDFNPFIDPKEYPADEESARKIVVEQISKNKSSSSKSSSDDFSSFSTALGDFWLGNPLEVVALIRGVHPRLLGEGNEPCFYVAYQKKDMDWYDRALEIVIETCDFVLKQCDSHNYYVHWSA